MQQQVHQGVVSPSCMTGTSSLVPGPPLHSFLSLAVQKAGESLGMRLWYPHGSCVHDLYNVIRAGFFVGGDFIGIVNGCV